MSKRHDSRAIEYVYNPENSPQEYQAVHIDLNADQNGKLVVSFNNEVEMTPLDVQHVLLYLDDAALKPTRINLLEECLVVVNMPSGKYSAILNDDLTVKELKGE